MSVVAAVSVSPTWAAPVMVGAPVAAEFSWEGFWLDGPGMTISRALDSILPSSVQTAPWLAQLVVTGSDTVTSVLTDGRTEISHLTFLFCSSRRTSVTSPPVTVKAWSAGS